MAELEGAPLISKEKNRVVAWLELKHWSLIYGKGHWEAYELKLIALDKSLVHSALVEQKQAPEVKRWQSTTVFLSLPTDR